MTWLQRLFCACPNGHRACALRAEPAEQSQAEPLVPSASPARALELSLTDPETRGEWTRKFICAPLGHGYERYRNEARNISLTEHYGYGRPLSTPFTLSVAEEKIVLAALDKWNAHRRSVEEFAALSRLTARGMSAGTVKTPKAAEGDSPPARSRKGRAPKQSA